jgi:Tol biopolymer transport system component
LADGGQLVAWQSRFVGISATGSIAPIADSPTLVQAMYPSPDGHTVAFTQNDAEGWRLWTVDANTGDLRDLGNMGSDPAGTRPPTEIAPEQKTSMYIAWSPDGSRLAFGGGYEPPYTMKTIDLTTGTVAHSEFPHGYPGEIEWSPDGTRLAVSTYDPARTRHESYVVDPATGGATHLLSGCIIVWSHASRFLAVHGDPNPGISIVDVETGVQGKLTHERNDTPWSWTD